ncbi:MAG: ABC transporter permease [Chloroherpetonaceae bacterium]|nr:ABC transporter permease [Chloroherpetonaceae bacterium]
MHQIVINPKKSRLSINFREIWEYRELLIVLAQRDLKIRYAQTSLGLLWVLIQPILTLLIFIIVFGKAAKVNTASVPYSLFALSGMCAWAYFSFIITQAGNSILGSQQLVTKIYFPRLILPLSKLLVGLVDFAVTFIFLLIMMAFMGVMPSHNIIWLPFFFFLIIFTGFAISLWLNALVIRFRDLQIIIPFLVQIGLYASPVGYPSAMIPSQYLSFYYLNPMAGVIEGFRWSILGGAPPEIYAFYSFWIIILMFISGLYFFRTTERQLADII